MKKQNQVTGLFVSELGISVHRGNDDSIVNHYSFTKKNYSKISDLVYNLAYHNKAKLYPCYPFLGYHVEIVGD
jgi:hypothetical protein